jgi:hypothetical protein
MLACGERSAPAAFSSSPVSQARLISPEVSPEVSRDFVDKIRPAIASLSPLK